ncbi:unnamed protein product [Caenorhabditis angaria]|uniref:Domain of unknown function DX domain-containing protein n=1 Tax=Caenorhabditis angaria TaxID=860376 RepID=A0A9P1N6C3_9PELO|nr:unnamed protein product [Caenorhabditis angaria]
MKAAIFWAILIVCPNLVHPSVLSSCPLSHIEPDEQPVCTGSESACKTDFEDGQCLQTGAAGFRCCPEEGRASDFKSNQKCNSSVPLLWDGLYCKKGYVYHVGIKHLKANKDSSKDCKLNSDCGEGSYCVGHEVVDGELVRKCYLIDVTEGQVILFIIIGVVVLVVIIAIIAIIITCCCCKRKKNGN